MVLVSSSFEGNLSISTKNLKMFITFGSVIQIWGMYPKKSYKIWKNLYIETYSLLCYSKHFKNKKWKKLNANY